MDYEIIRRVKPTLPAGKVFIFRADCITADAPPLYQVFSNRELTDVEEHSAIASYEKTRRRTLNPEPLTLRELRPYLWQRFLTWWRR